MNDLNLASLLPPITIIATIIVWVRFTRRNAPSTNNQTPPQASQPISKSWLKYIAVCSAILFTYVSCSKIGTSQSDISSKSSSARISGEDITRTCAQEAGIPFNEKDHKITREEFEIMGACVDRMVAAKKANNSR